MPSGRERPDRIDDYFKTELAKACRCTYAERLAAAIVLTAVCMWVLFGVVFEIATVRGSSMNPALRDGDPVLCYRLGKDYAAGDVVIIDNPDRRDYIKRIIGLPGDTVEIDEESGMVLRNGEALVEKYAAGATIPTEGGQTFPVTLGEDEYFLLGDNRLSSYDSRAWGPVSGERIKAKVILPSV